MTTRVKDFSRALPALLALLVAAAVGAAPAAAREKPAVTLSAPRAAQGAELTVSGTGWRPATLLTLLVCGQNMIGGTNSCANAAGRAVTTDARGAFSLRLTVAAPPKPCPCVVHVAAATGERATADAELAITGHPTAPLPEPAGTGRLAVLATTRLEGDSGILVFFGAPPSRRLVFTVGNLGTTPVKDPVFDLGTSHGVYAPQWEERQWRGTIPPGGKALVELPVELAAGAHGDYEVSVRYGGKVIAGQPWSVGRPWGVTLFWVLLAVVVPVALFRTGMAVVDRFRPAAPAARGPGRHRAAASALFRRGRPAAAAADEPVPGALPWFTPDSAPSSTRPTTKGPS
ncbi:neocarzinostatin apoprotein domain-containing protein [Streptomyces tsukubensis]|uniref:neocarzinostatin apoprotein domain-containing protein n=1 Tax=Streptomyces tsukubensis TaxID=83656 RepID=UPI00344D44D3